MEKNKVAVEGEVKGVAKGRNVTIGKESTTVAIILTLDEITLIDETVGHGNRSAYLRWLVDSADGKEGKRYLQLEHENRVLYRLLQKTKAQLEQRDQRLKAMKEGGDMQTQLISESLEEVTEKYKLWEEGIKKGKGKIPIKLKLAWIEGNAKSLRMKPQHLFSILESNNPAT